MGPRSPNPAWSTIQKKPGEQYPDTETTAPVASAEGGHGPRGYWVPGGGYRVHGVRGTGTGYGYWPLY